MREIKFRAWLKKENRMIYNIQNSYDFNTNNDCKDDNECCFGDYLNNDIYQVMQYTGLKDKNGNEIYEGDIVKIYSKGYDNSINYGIVEFKIGKFGYQYIKAMPYLNGSFGTFINKREYQDMGFTVEIEYSYEIIGNIYENKELIK